MKKSEIQVGQNLTYFPKKQSSVGVVHFTVVVVEIKNRIKIKTASGNQMWVSCESLADQLHLF